MRAVRVSGRRLAEVPNVGRILLDRAREDAVPWMACSVVVSSAVMLGALQRANQVVDMEVCARLGIGVFRRSTTGTAVWLGRRAVWWSLALPHVAALVPDATARTVLNRNVRGFLQGLSRVGATAMYTGREWLAVHRRPCAVLGIETTEEGAVLVDVMAGWDEPVALPDEITAPRERAVARWKGRNPVALGEIVTTYTPEAVGERVIEAVAARAGETLTWDDALGTVPDVEPVGRDDDPVPEGWVSGPGVRVPVGWVDAAVAREGTGGWIGGDALAGTWTLATVAKGGAWTGGALEGAVPEDLAVAMDLAHKARG